MVALAVFLLVMYRKRPYSILEAPNPHIYFGILLAGFTGSETALWSAVTAWPLWLGSSPAGQEGSTPAPV